VDAEHTLGLSQKAAQLVCAQTVAVRQDKLHDVPGHAGPFSCPLFSFKGREGSFRPLGGDPPREVIILVYPRSNEKLTVSLVGCTR
jgi:hypothetical protein